MEIITLDKLQLLEYDDFQKVQHDNGGKSANVNVSYNGDINPVLINFETMLYDDQVHVLSTRAYIDIVLNDIQVEYFQDFDERNIESVIANSELWFGQPFPEEIVREYYHPILNKKKKTGEYFCRVKINTSINLPQFTLVTKYVDAVEPHRLLKTSETTIHDLDQLHFQTVNVYLTHRGLQFGKKSFVCDLQFDKIEVIEYISTKTITTTHLPITEPVLLPVEKTNTDVTEETTILSLPTVKEEIHNELSELLPNDLEKFIVHENISLRQELLLPPTSYEFVETEDDSVGMDLMINKKEYNQKRKNVLLSRQSKYLQALNELKSTVEKEVEVALQKQNVVSEKYVEALQYYESLEKQNDFDPDDELIEDEILEKNGRLTPVFTFEDEELYS